jgi:hypothetical protein
MDAIGDGRRFNNQAIILDRKCTTDCAEEHSGFRKGALETPSLGISARSPSIRCDLVGTAYCKHGSQPLLSLRRWPEGLPRRRR